MNNIQNFGDIEDIIALYNTRQSENGVILKFIAIYVTVLSSNLSPYPSQTLKSAISITTRQKLKVKLYSDRARSVL